MLLDSFFQRELRPVNGEPVTINVYSHKGIDIEDVKEDAHVHLHAHAHHRGLMSMASIVLAWSQELDYPHYIFNEPALTLPLPVFQAAPPKGGSIVVLNVQVQSDTEVSIVISGSTWAFRTQPAP